MKMRATSSYYVSIPLKDHPVIADIKAAIKMHGGQKAITFVQDQGLHITLCHLGNAQFSLQDEQAIIKIIATVCEQFPEFELSTSGVVDFGVYESFARLEIKSETFDALQHKMVESLNQSGYKTSHLSCHISIARQPGNVGEQKRYNPDQMRCLQSIGHAIGKKSYSNSPVRSLLFCDGQRIISNIQLVAAEQNKPQLGVAIVDIVEGQQGMIQFHFATEAEAKKFLAFAQSHFNDSKTIVFRKDQPRVIRLSPKYYEKLCSDYPDDLNKFHRPDTAVKKY